MNTDTQPASGRNVLSRSLHGEQKIPVIAFGMALSLFLVISFVLCVLGYLVAPGLPIMHDALSIFLPGFQLLSWPDFFLGLAESFGWGWYVALVLGPLYNFFAR